ncbi:TPM domain-containing protein, partial [Aquipuribacter hungaricus]|uniref:TPM domain-containing protein n=1 Tax=Aquipuribacter hungaricus TaxID=545624 RepID=UPI00361A22C3
MTATDAGVALPLDDPAALTSQVTDSADVLDDTAAQSAVEELSQQTGVDLYVVYVDDFGGLESEEWVIETGSLTGLGETDAMLAVAVGDREFWFEPPASLTTAEGQAIREAVVDELGQDDWDGAVTAAATTTAQVVASEGGTGGAPAPAPAGGSSGLGGLLVLGVVAALGIALLVAVVRRSSRRRADAQGAAAAAPAPTGWGAVPTPELEQRAGSALLAGDEALRESEQELAFARAQFGDAGTEEFERAVTTARTELTAAFAARHQLDELQRARPDVPEQERRRLLVTVLERTQVADEALEAQAESMRRLRDLERSLPTLLPALESRTQAVRAEVDRAGQLLADLGASYDAAAVEPVRDNARHGRELVDFAVARLAEARQHVAAGTAGEGALAAHEAEAALARAEEQARAVADLQSHVRQALVQLPGTTVDLRADLAQAEAVLARCGDD